MRGREAASYKESASLRATQGSGDKLHLNNSVFTTALPYANAQEVCVLVHMFTSVHEIHMHLHVLYSMCMPARSRNKIMPQEALKGLYYCIWTSD